MADALLDLLARLPCLLLDLVDDLVGILPRFVNVLIGQLLELLNELRLQVVQSFPELVLERVIESHPGLPGRLRRNAGTAFPRSRLGNPTGRSRIAHRLMAARS